MLQKIIIERKKLGLTWGDLAVGLPIAGNSLRIAFKRGKVDQVYLNHVKDIIETYKKEKGNVQEVLSSMEDTLVLEGLADDVIKNHEKMLQTERYSNWFEVQCQKRVIEILKE
jgi:predicted transcriptional regulator